MASNVYEGPENCIYQNVFYRAEHFAAGEIKSMGWEIAKNLTIADAKVGLDIVCGLASR